ncbi:MAG: VTT domain-containing protein [Nitrososphaerota archaeon]
MSIFDPEFWSGLTFYGYTGVFASSLLGSMLPFISGPYIPPIIVAVVAGRLDPTLTAIVSAAGAASGKLVLFNVFKGGRRLLSQETLNKISPLERLVRRYGWIAVLLTAATPVPDDIVYVLLAISGYRNAYFFPLVFAGKLFITSVVAFVSIYWRDLACLLVECGPTGLNPQQALILAFSSAGAAMLLVYLITRLDWERLLRRVGLQV